MFRGTDLTSSVTHAAGAPVIVQLWEKFTGQKAKRLQAAPEKVPHGVEETGGAEATPAARVERTMGSSDVILAGGVR